MPRQTESEGWNILAAAAREAEQAGWTPPENDPGTSVLDPETGRPRVLSEECSDCVFRPGNLMHLRPGRLKELVEANTSQGAGLTCHQTLPGISDQAPAWCRGFYDRYPNTAIFLLGREIGGPVEVDPPRKAE